MVAAVQIPNIPLEKKYWLIRTKGGRFYNDFRSKGVIAINWDHITLEDIHQLEDNELSLKIRQQYPNKVRPGKASAQLRTFVHGIKQGDIVIITSYNSAQFSIGEVLEDDCFSIGNTPDTPDEENPKVCWFQKRRRVRWIKEVNKYDMDMPMFKLLQHARNTVNNADEYGDVIEGLLHDYFIRGDNAFFSLKVKRESNIPAKDFFKMGSEILDLVDEFGRYKEDNSFSSDGIDTKINVNSEGKAKFIGSVSKITAVAIIVVVCISGGGVNVTIPGADTTFDLHTNGLLREFTDFLNAKQEREQKELLLNTYMEHLQIEAPDELKGLIEAIENSNTGDSEE